MEGTRKEHWWRDARGDLSDLSTQFSGQQWRWDRDLRGSFRDWIYLKELGIDAIWLSPVCKSLAG